MAIDGTGQHCTIVLHETPVSKECVLCGTNILPQGALGYLGAPGAKLLCIAPKDTALNADEVSVHTSLANRFGFQNRMKATIQRIEDADQATATHVELLFRDQHLSRADMWRITAQVDGSVLYEGQKLKYLGSVTADVEAIYIAGQRVDSAYVLHPRTKLIFRSGSARFTLLIQISREMLDSWHGGDLMYERMLYGLLPALFKRWDSLKVRHHVSVVFFGRYAADEAASDNDDMTLTGPPVTRPASDFFQVIDEDLNGGNWRDLIRRLKVAFNTTQLPHQVCVAAEGNMLEAIHLAATDFALETLDQHLTSTGTSIIAITAGSGIFEADHNLLKKTTDLLMGNSTGVDIVSLSPKPPHPVPLFHYVREGSHEYALPHWVDMSYWPPDGQQPQTSWLMPEALQEVDDIAIDLLANPPNDQSSSAAAFMDSTDDTTFSRPHSIPPVNYRPRLEASAEISVQSHTTLKNSTEVEAEEPTPAAQILEQSVRTKRDSMSEPAPASIPSIQRAKREVLTPHPLLNTSRKISLGPRGLAPGRGVASTTVSVQFAQHERETTSQPPFTANISSSGLAKQIRASLARKPSQSSLSSRGTSDLVSEPAFTSKPIRIQSRESDAVLQEEDPANIMENQVMAGREDQSFSATPKGKRDSLPLPGMNALEDENGSISPWLTLLNPCNPRRDNMRVASEYRKWQHVFPRMVTAEDFKWDSMCTPAALPLMTEYRISSAALEKHFSKKVRRLVAKKSRADTGKARKILSELLYMRLEAGFQIVPRRTSGKMPRSLRDIDRVLLALGSVYHELSCLSEAEVQILEYERAQGVDEKKPHSPESAIQYEARIRSSAAKSLKSVRIPLLGARLAPDWSSLDEQSVNPTALAERQGLTVVRFVLLPLAFLKSDQSPARLRELTDDERHIEGIQKLTQLWQRHRYFTEVDQQHHASLIRSNAASADERDPNPLAVEYHTRDPSLVIKAHGPLMVDETANDITLAPLFSESEMYHTSDFDTAKLARHMQEAPPEGIEFKDRWWLTRQHLRCFRGDEMTNWLLRVFKDLETREDAVRLGNQLKDLGIFAHVRNKHDFRDGHYFYQIRPVYRTTDHPDSAGIFSKAMGRSVPPTPISETKLSPISRPVRDGTEGGMIAQTPILTAVDMKEVLMSQMMQYNVDSTRRSDQLEIVNLHYDRIHNPENCYHIQLDWTSTTAKLIRESVSRWTGLVETHGLKLVQIPLREAVRLHEDYPFDQPIGVKLAEHPAAKEFSTPRLDAQGSFLRAVKDPEAFHKALLRKMGFVLDFEAARNFPSRIQARYSWGTPEYRFTQFVHKSGLLLVQISNNEQSDFVLVPNRLALHTTVSPGRRLDGPSTAEIVERFVSFCRDGHALRAFYEDISRKSVSTPSPLVNASLAADAEIPPFQLPPDLASRHHK